MSRCPAAPITLRLALRSSVGLTLTLAVLPRKKNINCVSYAKIMSNEALCTSPRSQCSKREIRTRHKTKVLCQFHLSNHYRSAEWKSQTHSSSSTELNCGYALVLNTDTAQLNSTAPTTGISTHYPETDSTRFYPLLVQAIGQT